MNKPFLEQSDIVSRAAGKTKGLDKSTAALLDQFITERIVSGLWDAQKRYVLSELTDGTKYLGGVRVICGSIILQ